MKKIVTVTLLFLLALNNGLLAQPAGAQEFYELRVYHYKDSAQEGVIDRYLEKALIPALGRKKITRIGVFKALSNDTSAIKTLYLLVPFKSVAGALEIQSALLKDNAYLSAGKEYLEAGFKTPPYTRVESIWLKAFPFAPVAKASKLKSSPQGRVYELRSYESATEKIGVNKIHMFNEGGEVALFDRLGFDAAFYGQVLSGGVMPNLMYLTRFENRAERDAHWKAFGEDPEWKQLSAKPEYQDNVSHIDITFLRPTAYSAL
ncbi:MAG: NIPSNAP family containing protein [Chitinophagaceae bacterium]|nr:MAG: NIPSNAP family containing protein [Chitinophagaceae bacterium]